MWCHAHIHDCSYLYALWDQIGLGDKVIMVLHDWGSAMGFDWANGHRDRVQGIVYMEAIVTPLTWADWPENARRVFQGFRSESGEEMILQKNMFVERVLPSSIIRKLSEDEMAAYRKPFARSGEDRRPTLTWPRMIPIEGKPADVVNVVESYAAWLARADVPKLFINADPGSILVGRQRELCRAWLNQTEVTVKGRHFLQEDSPDDIGRCVADFVRRVRSQ
jgi:haloalkane dehalogenase